MKGKLPDNFIKERYLKDDKYIHVYDTYTFNYNKTNVTAKFYSKYEGHYEEPDPVLLENLKRAKDYDPKQKLQWPETENQWYGWFNEPFVEVDKNDARLYFPQRSSELTKHGLKMLQEKIPKNRK
ncbi:cilia- and flagella-associated protein 144-like [Leptinotarsa decemlineata]|uniref:cilia- and flagella-associated protein 144-like n=1 Tax=Leptinotarsa decemlineata TaxID=7539 RepID=UPI003D30625A